MAVLRAVGALTLGLFYAASWAWMVAFAVIFALAVAQFGHVPSYGNPDPKWVAGSWLPQWELFLLFFPAALSPLVVGGEAAWRLARKERLRVAALALYAPGFALFAAIMFADAFGLRNWILD